MLILEAFDTGVDEEKAEEVEHVVELVDDGDAETDHEGATLRTCMQVFCSLVMFLIAI